MQRKGIRRREKEEEKEDRRRWREKKKRNGRRERDEERIWAVKAASGERSSCRTFCWEAPSALQLHQHCHSTFYIVHYTELNCICSRVGCLALCFTAILHSPSLPFALSWRRVVTIAPLLFSLFEWLAPNRVENLQKHTRSLIEGA